MCNFLSAIVLQNGDILCDPEHTDSHEDLIAAHGLDNIDDAHVLRFARVEFRPGLPIDDPSNYTLWIDEAISPVWLDDSMRSRVEEDLRIRVSRMIVRDKRRTLLGGCWVLGNGASVRWVVGGRIVAMCGNASIRGVRGHASISDVRDHASISDVWGSVSIRGVRGNASISGDRRNSK